MLLELIVLTIILFLCIYIFVNVLLSSTSVNKPQRKAFASVVFWIMLWVLTILITVLSTENLLLALWMSRLSFVTSLLVVFSFFIFVTKYQKDKDLRVGKYIFSIGTVILSVLSFTDLLVKDVALVDGGIKSTSGPLTLYYAFFIAAIYLYSFIVFYKNYKKEKNLVMKTQMLYILIGSTLTMFFSFITNLVFPMLGFKEIRSLGPLSLIFFMMGTYYSILRYRFASNRALVTRFLYTLALALLTYGIFYLVFFIQISIWGDIFSTGALIMGIVLAFIFIYLFSLVAEKVKGFFEVTFYQSAVVQEKELDLFVKKQNTLLDIDRILVETKNLLERVFATKCGFLISTDMKYQDNHKNLIEYKMSPEDLRRVVAIKKVVIRDELYYHEEDFSKLFSLLQKHRIQIVIPVLSLKNIDWNLHILLGDKGNQESYSIQDIEFVESIESLLSVSIQRAYLHQKVLDFNKTLEQKVQQQTEELQQKVTELEEARRKERDMIDIMGHELRTPAAIVKLNTNLLEKYVDSNPKNYKKYLDKIKNSIENEIRLIDTLLSSAKLEGRKLEINKERVSVPEQIEVVLHGYEYQAEAKGLKLISDIDEDTKDVYADKVRVGEIIDNLVSNAIKYTDEGSVIVKTESTDDYVKVSVIDTGKGIPEDEVPKLGTKFHRVEQYISGDDGFNIVRPGGTGLGLYVVYALIEMMGGKIWVDTEVGKGTTFFFTLPVYKGQREDIVATDSKNMFDKFGLKK